MRFTTHAFPIRFMMESFHWTWLTLVIEFIYLNKLINSENSYSQIYYIMILISSAFTLSFSLILFRDIAKGIHLSFYNPNFYNPITYSLKVKKMIFSCFYYLHFFGQRWGLIGCIFLRYYGVWENEKLPFYIALGFQVISLIFHVVKLYKQMGD